MSELPGSVARLGARLWVHEGRLRLLFEHLAGRVLRASLEPDDLVQEVFLRALARPDLWPAEEPALGRYLVGIARHAVIDAARALRARKRDARLQPLVSSEWSRAGVRESGLALPGPGPGTHAAQAEHLADLTRAFRALAPDHRRVIGLRQFEGLDARETGRRMGRSETAVHSLYRRALQAWDAGTVSSEG